MEQALEKQPGDHAAARDVIARSPLLQSTGADLDTERECVLRTGLKYAETQLARAEIWALVVKIATACLDNEGVLTQTEIEKILKS